MQIFTATAQTTTPGELVSTTILEPCAGAVCWSFTSQHLSELEMRMGDKDSMLRHGAMTLPGAIVDSYNLDIKNHGEILNLRVRKGASQRK